MRHLRVEDSAQLHPVIAQHTRVSPSIVEYLDTRRVADLWTSEQVEAELEIEEIDLRLLHFEPLADAPISRRRREERERKAWRV